MQDQDRSNVYLSRDAVSRAFKLQQFNTDVISSVNPLSFWIFSPPPHHPHVSIIDDHGMFGCQQGSYLSCLGKETFGFVTHASGGAIIVNSNLEDQSNFVARHLISQFRSLLGIVHSKNYCIVQAALAVVNSQLSNG